MDCYYIKPDNYDELDEVAKVFADSIDQNKREFAEKKVDDLAKQLKGHKGKISIYCEDRLVSMEVLMILRQKLSKNHQISDDNIIVDRRLNAFNPKGLFLRREVKEYAENAFNVMSEILMTHDENDAIVMIAGDSFWQVCQQDESIHNLIYFGDEQLYLPNHFIRASTGFFERDMLDEKMSELAAKRALMSFKVPRELIPEKIIIDRPEIEKETGILEPVYYKHAKRNLIKKIRDDGDGSQPGSGV